MIKMECNEILNWDDFFYDLICNNENNYAFFVGAGISVASGLPKFMNFLDKFITNLVPDEWKYKITDPLENEQITKRLRPEVLLQLIYQIHGNKTLDFYKVLDGGVPNFNHYFLALCILKGHCIITPNVDNLIEKACDELGISYETIYISQNESIKSHVRSYQDIVNDKNAAKFNSKIFKFHGSIESTSENILQRYESIRFTLNRLGLGLDKYMSEVIEDVIQERNVVFLGYSGNDHFSVYPLLLKTESDQKFYWFKFIINDELKKIENQRFDEQRTKYINQYSENAFFENMECMSILEILISKYNTSHLILGNSSKKIEQVVLKIKENEIENIKNITDKIPTKINIVQLCEPDIPWIKNDVTDFQKQYLISLLFYRASLRQKASIEIEKCLIHAQPNDYAHINYLRARIYSFTRNNYEKTVSEIVELMKKNTLENKRISDFRLEIELANMQRAERKYKEALERLDKVEESIEIFKKNGLFEKSDDPYEYSILMSQLLNVRALIYGMGLVGDINNQLKALQYCDQALMYSSQAGDVFRKASDLNSKGLIITQLSQRIYDLLHAAKISLNESLTLSSQIQQIERGMQTYRNLMLIDYLYCVNTKFKVQNYWLNESTNTIIKAEKYLKLLNETKSTYAGHEREIEFRKSQIMGLKEIKDTAFHNFNTLLDTEKKNSSTSTNII